MSLFGNMKNAFDGMFKNSKTGPGTATIPEEAIDEMCSGIGSDEENQEPAPGEEFVVDAEHLDGMEIDEDDIAADAKEAGLEEYYADYAKIKSVAQRKQYLMDQLSEYFVDPRVSLSTLKRLFFTKKYWAPSRKAVKDSGFRVTKRGKALSIEDSTGSYIKVPKKRKFKRMHYMEVLRFLHMNNSGKREPYFTREQGVREVYLDAAAAVISRDLLLRIKFKLDVVEVPIDIPDCGITSFNKHFQNLAMFASNHTNEMETLRSLGSTHDVLREELSDLQSVGRHLRTNIEGILNTMKGLAVTDSDAEAYREIVEDVAKVIAFTSTMKTRDYYTIITSANDTIDGKSVEFEDSFREGFTLKAVQGKLRGLLNSLGKQFAPKTGSFSQVSMKGTVQLSCVRGNRINRSVLTRAKLVERIHKDKSFVVTLSMYKKLAGLGWSLSSLNEIVDSSGVPVVQFSRMSDDLREFCLKHIYEGRLTKEFTKAVAASKLSVIKTKARDLLNLRHFYEAQWGPLSGKKFEEEFLERTGIQISEVKSVDPVHKTIGDTLITDFYIRAAKSWAKVGVVLSKNVIPNRIELMTYLNRMASVFIITGMRTLGPELAKKYSPETMGMIASYCISNFLLWPTIEKNFTLLKPSLIDALKSSTRQHYEKFRALASITNDKSVLAELASWRDMNSVGFLGGTSSAEGLLVLLDNASLVSHPNPNVDQEVEIDDSKSFAGGMKDSDENDIEFIPIPLIEQKYADVQNSYLGDKAFLSMYENWINSDMIRFPSKLNGALWRILDMLECDESGVVNGLLSLASITYPKLVNHFPKTIEKGFPVAALCFKATQLHENADAKDKCKIFVKLLHNLNARFADNYVPLAKNCRAVNVSACSVLITVIDMIISNCMAVGNAADRAQAYESTIKTQEHMQDIITSTKIEYPFDSMLRSFMWMTFEAAFIIKTGNLGEFSGYARTCASDNEKCWFKSLMNMNFAGRVNVMFNADQIPIYHEAIGRIEAGYTKIVTTLNIRSLIPPPNNQN